MEAVVSDADQDQPVKGAPEDVMREAVTPEAVMPEPVADPATSEPDDVGTAAVEDSVPGPVVITGSQVTGLRATHAEISQSSIDSLDAERVDLSHSHARQIEGRLVQMTDAVAIRVEGKRIVAENTRVVGIISDQARFVRSRIGLAITRQTELSADSRILVHLGPLRSDIRPTVTTPTALAFGAGVGLVLTAGLRLLGRRSR